MRYRERRYPCQQKVDVWLADRKNEGVIVNISPKGARMSRFAGAVTGARIRIDPGLGCPIHEAEVRWARGSFVGLRFDTPLDPRTLALIRKSGDAQSARPAAHPKSGWNLHLRELR